MKFGKRLQNEVVIEWEDYYVKYKRLKQFIYKSELRGDAFATELFSIISQELAQAERLFKELINELQEEHDRLLDMDPELLQTQPSQMRKFYRKHSRKNISTSLGEESVSMTGNSSLYEADLSMADGGRRNCALRLKNFFLFTIGDFRRKHMDSDTPKAQFFKWHASACQLQHFADLNVEAIRKSSKKLKKYRRTEPDFTIAIENAISQSPLSMLMPRLHNLMNSITADYEKKFKEPIGQYASINFAQEWHANWHFVVLAIVLFYITLYSPILPTHPAAHNCVALFVLVVVLWLTEAIPFFCTAMLIPIVAVPLRIVSEPGTHHSASPSVASQILLGKVFNHVQILIMGGLTIGKACARTHLEMYAASALHRLAAHRPALYLLGVMLGSFLLCAFVSNVAAPLLVLGVIQRTLWEFPEGTTAPHAFLLALAFACNFGGMLSPIASPQNAVAMTVLSFNNVSFSAWVSVALPVGVLGVLVAWAIILVVWKPFEEVSYIPLQVVDFESAKKVSNVERAIVLLVSLFTIFLWILPENNVFGDTGVVALIPIVVFFGIGILSKDDFNTLSWHLMFLLAGGNMLGLCARDSQMLDILAQSVRHTLSTASPYITFVTVILLVSIISTFVSHTVAAMILLPIIANIGFLMPESDGLFAITPQTLVMLSALMCSGAMAFPISSFPNVNSLLAEDERGIAYLHAKDFLFCGTFVQLFFTFCLFTWMVPVTNFFLD